MIKAKLAARITDLAGGPDPVRAGDGRARPAPHQRSSRRHRDRPGRRHDRGLRRRVSAPSPRCVCTALRALETGEPVLLRLVPDDAADGRSTDRRDRRRDGRAQPVPERRSARDLPRAAAARAADRGGRRLADRRRAGRAGRRGRVRRSARRRRRGRGAGRHGRGRRGLARQARKRRFWPPRSRPGFPTSALVASPKRGAAIRESLGVPEELAAQLHTPAGLDIGARTPGDIAISILAELVAEHHADPGPGRPRSRRPRRRDPVCGMTVVAAETTLHLDHGGERVYFCGPGCRDAYAALHAGDAAPG